jgi:hypothetical protein
MVNANSELKTPVVCAVSQAHLPSGYAGDLREREILDFRAPCNFNFRFARNAPKIGLVRF